MSPVFFFLFSLLIQTIILFIFSLLTQTIILFNVFFAYSNNYFFHAFLYPSYFLSSLSSFHLPIPSLSISLMFPFIYLLLAFQFLYLYLEHKDSFVFLKHHEKASRLLVLRVKRLLRETTKRQTGRKTIKHFCSR